MNPNDILTSREVAEMLGGVDLGYLYYLDRSNQLHPIPQKTIQRKPRLKYRRSDVEAFLTKRAQEQEEAPSFRQAS